MSPDDPKLMALRVVIDQALETVVDCANQHGLTVAGTAPSPIEGTHGNTEFLLFARMDDIAAKAD